MLSDLWPIIASVLGVFLVIGVGAFCRQMGWLTRESDSSLANLTAKVLLPSLFADRILNSEQLHQFSSAWFPPVFGFCFTTLGFLISLLIAKRFGHWIGLDTDAKQRTFALCVGICNYGYIPLPLAFRFYPDAVVELILHNVGVDMALWSVGIAVIGGATTWRRAVLTAPMIAVVTTSVIRYLGIDQMIPSSFLGAVSMLGSCSIPMGLMLSGAIIVDNLQKIEWADSMRVVCCAIGIRQLLLPLLMLAILTVLTLFTPLVSHDMKLVVMLEAAMPAAVFPIVLVRLYHRDTSTALRVVLPTSLAGLVLVPLWLGISKWWLGV
ncbi:AEC family transporter [Novipirellula artificiosorum]|uniref:Membrane transport protein n=1 Tax=Novipirellula artificiosorum TaxID=2528016 RepID=A0A5C6DUI3_9BACT|nr:AEC family transporter [Novipirellula artificiosorum]TWU41023.1 Membrane transport protein [Novipirellula artificiosorum]